MEYVEIPPHPTLSRWVRCFWFLRDEPGAAPGPPEDVFPDGCAEIVFHLGDPFFHYASETRRIQPRGFIVGPTTSPMKIGPTGRVDVVGIRLQPHASSAVLRLPSTETLDRTLPFDEVLSGSSWYDQLHHAVDPAAQARLLDGLIAGVIDPQRTDALVETACGIIAKTAGRLTVGELSRSLGVGMRRLERRFRTAAGMGPKTLCRIVRFQRALGELRRGDHGLAGAAMRCGYHDQSHFTRDFVAFAGRAPGSFLSSEDLLPRLFAGLEAS